MIEILMKLFPFMNIIWFQGNWHTERVVDHAPVPIDSIVVHSFEVESTAPPPISDLTYDQKDKNYVEQGGACANVLALWSKSKVGAHYIVSSESIQKITSDLQSCFPDLKDRADSGQYATYVHSPKDIALICCVPDKYAAYHAGASRFDRFGVLPVGKLRYTLNFSSIGIELQGNGFYEHDKSNRNFDQFWPEQISILTQLIETLAKKYTLNTTTDVVTHSTIAPLRKKDPGRYFPFKALAEKQIGWILEEPVNNKEEKLPCVDHTRTLLMRIGYQLPEEIKNVQDVAGREEQLGCIFESSSPNVIWSTLDGFSLQYTPWAWETQLAGAHCLSEAARGRVVMALEEHLKPAMKEKKVEK